MLCLGFAGLTGCLFDPPVGSPQVWPPPLGVQIGAVTVGHFDGDVAPEVILFGTQRGGARAGIYVMVGNRDIAFGTGTPLRGFTLFTAAGLAEPVAALQHDDGSASRVFVANAAEGEDMLEVTAYLLAPGAGGAPPAVTQEASIRTGISAGASRPWIRPVMFPSGLRKIAVSNGTAVEHMTLGLTDVRPLPSATSLSWNQIQLATSYAVGTDQFVVGATPTEIQRAKIPVPGPVFVYETLRAGAPWSGQTAFDLDGDGRDEILGFERDTGRLCAIDIGQPAPTTPACLAVDALPGEDVSLIVGHDVDGAPGREILIAYASGADTQYVLVEDYSYAAGQLVATRVRTLSVAGPPRGFTFAIHDAGTSTTRAVVTLGTEGQVACVAGPC